MSRVLKILRNIAIIITSIFVLILMIGVFSDDTTHIERPIHVTTSTQLYAEYEANEVKADNKYKGNIVVVTGTIHDIGKDVFDNAYIVLEPAGILSGVQCTFADKYLYIFDQVSKGQHVRIKGTVSGFVLGSVMMKNCSP